MKRNAQTLLICTLAWWSMAAPLHAQQTVEEVMHAEHGLDGNQFCNYIARRFYFVKRLHNTMLLFLDVENRIERKRYKSRQLDQLFTFTHHEPFRDARIQKSIDIMQQKRTLKPLFMIWDDFTSYRSIKDQLFVEEFTKEVFIISRNMLVSLHHSNDWVVEPSIRQYRSVEHLLDAIDMMTHQLCQLEGIEVSSRVVDLHTFAHVDDVMLRFYVIKRLKHAIETLGTLERSSQLYTNWLHRSRLRHETLVWHHPHIVSCLRVMDQTQSVQPLLQLWDDIEQYKLIQDDLFMQEFAQLVLYTYTDLVAWYAEHNVPIKKNVVATAIEVYQVIDQLPLEEILDVIDIITHELPPLLEKYEFDSELSWRAWFKRYWWAPPLILATLGIRIFMNWELKQLLSEPPAPQPVSKSDTTSLEGDDVWNSPEALSADH